MSEPLTLGEFRRQTAHLPDDVLMLTYAGWECEEEVATGLEVVDYVVEWEMPERRAPIASLLGAMGGPGCTPKRTQPAVRLA